MAIFQVNMWLSRNFPSPFVLLLAQTFHILCDSLPSLPQMTLHLVPSTPIVVVTQHHPYIQHVHTILSFLHNQTDWFQFIAFLLLSFSLKACFRSIDFTLAPSSLAKSHCHVDSRLKLLKSSGILSIYLPLRL